MSPAGNTYEPHGRPPVLGVRPRRTHVCGMLSAPEVLTGRYLNFHSGIQCMLCTPGLFSLLYQSLRLGLDWIELLFQELC